MSSIQLPATRPSRPPWNKGRLIGQKRPNLPRQVWAIRARLELADNLRDLALFNLAIYSKLRGRDLVRLKVVYLVAGGSVRDRASVVQSETGRPVQFEVSENTRRSLLVWVTSRSMFGQVFLFPSRFHGSKPCTCAPSRRPQPCRHRGTAEHRRPALGDRHALDRGQPEQGPQGALSDGQPPSLRVPSVVVQLLPPSVLSSSCNCHCKWLDSYGVRWGA